MATKYVTEDGLIIADEDGFHSPVAMIHCGANQHEAARMLRRANTQPELLEACRTLHLRLSAILPKLFPAVETGTACTIYARELAFASAAIAKATGAGETVTP